MRETRAMFTSSKTNRTYSLLLTIIFSAVYLHSISIQSGIVVHNTNSNDGNKDISWNVWFCCALKPAQTIVFYAQKFIARHSIVFIENLLVDFVFQFYFSADNMSTKCMRFHLAKHRSVKLSVIFQFFEIREMNGDWSNVNLAKNGI